LNWLFFIIDTGTETNGPMYVTPETTSPGDDSYKVAFRSKGPRIANVHLRVSFHTL